MNKSKWIKVADEMPEPMKRVLVWNGRYTTTGIYVSAKTIDFKTNYRFAVSETFYDRENNVYWVQEGFYETSMQNCENYKLFPDITHWQPLPESPEDEACT